MLSLLITTNIANFPALQFAENIFQLIGRAIAILIFVQPSKLFGGQTSVLKMARLEWYSFKTKINANKKQIKSTVSSK